MRRRFPAPRLPAPVAAALAAPSRACTADHGWQIGRLIILCYAVAAVALNLDGTFGSDLSAVNDFDGAFPADLVQRGAVDLGVPSVAVTIVQAAIGTLGDLVNLALAWLLLRRRRADEIVLLVALVLIAGVGAQFPPSLHALMATHPIRATIGKIVTSTWIVGLVALFFLFPTGRFVPRWTIVPFAAWIMVIAGVFFFHGTAIDSWNWPPLPTAFGFLAVFGPAIYAQIYRFRRVSGPLERQQTKWVLAGLGVAAGSFVGFNVFLAFMRTDQPLQSPPAVFVASVLFPVLFGLGFLCLSVSLAVAVLRHRLFDIDIIVNRAIVYLLLTVGVVGLYVLVVGYLGALFHSDGNVLMSLAAAGVVAVAFQPLRQRLQQAVNRLMFGDRDDPYGVLARLGRRLEATLAPEAVLPAIVETVTEALRLPYAAIALFEEDDLRVVAESGRSMPDSLRLPLVYQRETVGELRLAARAPGAEFSSADHRLLSDLARQAGVAAHAVRLTDALRRSRERLVTMREEERRRLRRDLHDGLGPALLSAGLKLGAVRRQLPADSPALLLLMEVRDDLRTTAADVRRLVHGLRPPTLDQLGLVVAIREHAEACSAPRGDGEPGLHVTVDAPNQIASLPAAVEVAAYRIAQEALTNVVRHANARACLVRISLDYAALELEISDDGDGPTDPDEVRQGVGLGSMRERAEELGGTFAVLPQKGGGLRVLATLPLGLNGVNGGTAAYPDRR